MKMRLAWMAAAAGIALMSAGIAAAEDDITKDPGYVDFGAMNLFGKEDTTVEIFLDENILKMVGAFVGDDPELQAMLGKLKQVRAQTFKIDPPKLKDIEARTEQVAKKLEAQGWSALVKVRDRQEGGNTYVYMKLNDKKIQGVAVMNVNPREDVSFVNIVGEVDPAQLHRLSRTVHIDALDSLDVLPDRHRKDDRNDKDSRKN